MNRSRSFTSLLLVSAPGLAVTLVVAFALAATAPVHAAATAKRTEKPAKPPQETSDSSTVLLPEFEANGLRPWCYVEFPGYEILSLASEKETEQYARRLRSEQAFFELFLPASSRHTPAHTAFSLVLGSPAFEEIREKSQHTYWLDNTNPIRAGDDRVFMMLSDWETRKGRAKTAESRHLRELGTIRFTSQFLQQLIVMRRVHFELPEWYWQGLLVVARSAVPGVGERVRFRNYALSDVTLRAGSDVRLPPAANGEVSPSLLPLERLFSLRRVDFIRGDAGGTPRGARELYTEQCGLFIRWACWAEAGRHRAALLRFVAEAGRDAPTERRFRECFGMDFAEADRVLAKFVADEIRPEMEKLRDATRSRATAQLRKSQPPASEEDIQNLTDQLLAEKNPKGITLAILGERSLQLPPDVQRTINSPLTVRPATRAEVTRIVGETYLWSARGERLAGSEVSAPTRPTQREISERSEFFATARRKLRRVHDDGVRDPQSLAALAFLEQRDGHESTARELLETAVAAGVLRPAAYTTLADLELDEAAKTARTNPADSAARIRRARELTHEALRQFPQMPAAHELLARCWYDSGQVPPSEELEPLLRFARSEHASVSAVIAIAKLHVRARLPERAADLAQRFLARREHRVESRALQQIERLAELSEASK